MYKYVKVKAYGGQVIHRILAQVQLTVVGPLTHKVVISLVPGWVAKVLELQLQHQILASLLIRYRTLGKFLNLVKPQFPLERG